MPTDVLVGVAHSQEHDVTAEKLEATNQKGQKKKRLLVLKLRCGVVRLQHQVPWKRSVLRLAHGPHLRHCPDQQVYRIVSAMVDALVT